MSLIQPVKIAVVGAGHVGASLSYSLLLRGLAAEIILIDQDTRKAASAAMQLQHAVAFHHPTEVKAGTLRHTAGAAITVICAGVRSRSRLPSSELLKHNAAIIKEVVPQIVEANPEGIILVASEPVDVLTYGAWRLSGQSRQHVFGMGTLLDTTRLRHLLGKQFRINPGSVHAFIVGEHGGTAVPIWSCANVAGMNIREACKAQGSDPSVLTDIFRQTLEADSALRDTEGARGFAMGAELAQLLAAIVNDEKRVFTVSSVLQGEYGVSNVALSVPTVVGSKGVERVLKLELDDNEVAQFLRSGRTVYEAILDAEFVVTSRLRAS